MNQRDPHNALKHQTLREAQAPGISAKLVRSQWSRTEIGVSLHVYPNAFTTSGLQATDFLSMLGFSGAACGFFPGGKCYVRWCEDSFDIDQFARSFTPAYQALSAGERDLNACGLLFDQPEGWAFFTGRRGPRGRAERWMDGDGHTAIKIEAMKQCEDEAFEFRLTWIDRGGERGWVIHYRPKHGLLSPEVESMFSALRLLRFRECPEFDFEPCHYRSLAFDEGQDDVFNRQAESAHRWFDAHATRFSVGVQSVLAAQAEMEKVGLGFLRIAPQAARRTVELSRRVVQPIARPALSAPTEFDVALSFAGTERPHAEALAIRLKDAGVSVFYDNFFPEELWGKNLADFFDDIYRKRSRFCVMFVSAEYRDREWTNHERQSAQARAIKEKGNAYILPIKVDDTELPGMPPTIGYLPLALGIEQIGALLVSKLKK